VRQSEKWLKEKGNVGDYIFRPSRSNKDQLTISWLFMDGVVKHLPVKEVGDEHDVPSPGRESVGVASRAGSGALSKGCGA
jgi:hypothetical protein